MTFGKSWNFVLIDRPPYPPKVLRAKEEQGKRVDKEGKIAYPSSIQKRRHIHLLLQIKSIAK